MELSSKESYSYSYPCVMAMGDHHHHHHHHQVDSWSGRCSSRVGKGSWCLHTQVLRIKQEDSQIGMDDFVRDYFFHGFLPPTNSHHLFHQPTTMISSKTVLPASPLSRTCRIHTSHSSRFPFSGQD